MTLGLCVSKNSRDNRLALNPDSTLRSPILTNAVPFDPLQRQIDRGVPLEWPQQSIQERLCQHVQYASG